MWFGPTAELVSGGAELTVNDPAGPVKPFPTPRKLLAGDGAAPATDVCTTGSEWVEDGRCGMNSSRSVGSSLGWVWAAAGGMSRNAFDLSWWVECSMVTSLWWPLPLSLAGVAPATDAVMTVIARHD